MARCEGRTKSGARCKRPAGQDASYCSLHADQASGGTRRTAPRSEARAARPARAASANAADPLVSFGIIGIAALAAFVLRRLFRLL